MKACSMHEHSFRDWFVLRGTSFNLLGYAYIYMNRPNQVLTSWQNQPGFGLRRIYNTINLYNSFCTTNNKTALSASMFHFSSVQLQYITNNISSTALLLQLRFLLVLQ